MNPIDYLLLALVLFLLAGAVYLLIRRKKKGSSCCQGSCSGDCASCSGCLSSGRNGYDRKKKK